jgi:hypothetical protein
MNGLRGYETDDVTKVELNRSTDASEDEDKEETIDTGFVKKAVLNGEGVNSSAIFSQLHEKVIISGVLHGLQSRQVELETESTSKHFSKTQKNAVTLPIKLKG